LDIGNLFNLTSDIEGNELLLAVINAVPTPIFVKDSEGIYIGCNTAFEQYIGLSKTELIGKGVFDLFDPKLAEVYYNADKALFDSREKQIYEAQVGYADGSVHDVVFHKAYFSTPSGKTQGIVGAILDNTEQKKAEAKLEKLALNDYLTGLHNRYSLLKELNSSIDSIRNEESQVAFMMLDLDNFKLINDTYGHPTGDALLVNVAKRLKETIRSTDFVARLGGDEFAVVLKKTTTTNSMISMAKKIISAFHRPINVNGNQFTISLSLGISVAPIDGLTSSDLMRTADVALYQAKNHPSQKYQFYSH
jgi:diguanylate cyclase (GGDEF)-like protein/PAS domain S-box-containing protein